MKIFNKTLAAVAVVAVSSLLSQKANAQDLVTNDFDMDPTTEIGASESSTTRGWEHLLERENEKAQNKDKIEAVKAEVKAIMKTRKLTKDEKQYYTEKLATLGCGLISVLMILDE